MPRDAFVTDSTDEQQLAFAERKVKEQVALDRALWREVLSSYEGRQFLWECVLGKLPITEDFHGDLPFVYRMLGRRSVGLEFDIEIAKHPELMLQMRNEAVKRDQQRRKEIAAQRLTEKATTQT